MRLPSGSRSSTRRGVKAWHGDINYDMGIGVFRHVDAIVGCLDNREARLSMNRASWAVGKPWVDGAIQELMGIVRVFWPGRGACYECTLSDADYQAISLRYSCPLLARENILQGKGADDADKCQYRRRLPEPGGAQADPRHGSGAGHRDVD
jgi:hypothetical protein